MEGDIDDFDDDNIGGGDYNLCTGNDVYFECDVKANPVPHKLIWLHNVSWKMFLYFFVLCVLNICVLDMMYRYFTVNLFLCLIPQSNQKQGLSHLFRIMKSQRLTMWFNILIGFTCLTNLALVWTSTRSKRRRINCVLENNNNRLISSNTNTCRKFIISKSQIYHQQKSNLSSNEINVIA